MFMCIKFDKIHFSVLSTWPGDTSFASLCVTTTAKQLFNLSFKLNHDCLYCLEVADSKGGGVGADPYWLIFFSKSRFLSVKGIYFVVRIRDK